MKTLYLECNMGAAGDMLMAALLELYPQPEQFLETMNSLGIPEVNITRHPAEKCGIQGTNIVVKVNGNEEESIDVANSDEHKHVHHHGHTQENEQVQKHEHIQEHKHSHSHSSMTDIISLIESLLLPQRVKNHAIAVYKLIAQAESHAHGKPAAAVHFHEVGAMDAVADIVGVCLLMELLSPEQIIVSPIHVGSGQVKTAHGVLPVPAPATAYILRQVPIYSTGIQGELCTPTGAALLKHFATKFAPMPPMEVKAIGYGMGKKDFVTANCVRAFWGDDNNKNAPNSEILELRCNLDDMTPEAIGFAMDILFENNALDVFTVPILMKKNRPAVLLVCLCCVSDTDNIVKLMLKHTTTIGVRKIVCSRYKLSAEFSQMETQYGPIQIKTSSGYGITKSKPEYTDVVKAARVNDVSFGTVYNAAHRENIVEVPNKHNPVREPVTAQKCHGRQRDREQS